MSFKDDYARFPQPGPEREAFVLKAVESIPKEQIVNSMKPVTVPGPNGTKVTYRVMPDYLKIDGIRVPMAGTTAQKVADYFGLNLPTPKMVQEIYQNADIQVPAQPLSGSGVNIDGKQYSGNQVVNTGVGYAPFAVAYNQKVDKQLEEKGYKGNGIVAGFAKDITPPINGKLGLYGLFDAKGKPIQGGSGETPHETKAHTEYGTYVRLVSPTVTITHPDGSTEERPLGEVYQYARYTPKSGTGEAPGKPDQSGGTQHVDQFLAQLSGQMGNTAAIFDKMVKKYGALESSIQIMPSIGKDPAIRDLTQASIPGHPPEGYAPLSTGESNAAIGQAARQILENSTLGDQVPFTIEGKRYMGRSEPHFHPIPPAGADKSKYPKPWGWHRGVTVFKAVEGGSTPEGASVNTPPAGSSNSKGRMSMLQRIDDFLEGLKSGS